MALFQTSVRGAGTAAVLLLLAQCLAAQQTTPAAPPASSSPATQPSAVTPAPQGGTIQGTTVAGVPGKPGGTPLPGVAITATNTLTGKKYTTASAVDGSYAMTIPRNGRYVVRAELAGFASSTEEVVLSGSTAQLQAEAAKQAITITLKQTDFHMELASRAAADEARQAAAATSVSRGLQSLSLIAGGSDLANASSGSSAAGAALPTLAGIGDSSADAVTVSGQTGTTNGLANFSEDEIRSRIEDAVAQGRASGMIPQGGDPTNAIVGMLGGMMGGRGPGGGGGFGGGRGGGGFGSGAFRNFNPAQPHGSVFYQGGNSALNSAPWSPTLLPRLTLRPTPTASASASRGRHTSLG